MSKSGLWAGAIVLAFLAVTTTVILTRCPWWDEGILTHPSYNLCKYGKLVSTILAPTWNPRVPQFEGIDKYTYWTLPLYLVTLAGWWKIVGISIFTARYYSVFWGIVLMGALYSIVRRLTGSRGTGLLAAALAATDYTIILSASTARPDIMSAGLGYAGLAAYLALRERNLRLAALAGAAGAAASVFTHPVGLMQSGGLLLVALLLDWRRISWREILCAAVPYLAIGGGWGLYILQDPAMFQKQFFAHTAYRTGALSHPLVALTSDFMGRYVHSFTGPGAEKYKILILIFYAAALLAALVIAPIRRSVAGRVLLSLAFLYYCELALFDSAWFPHYFVHVFPTWIALLAVVAAWLHQKKGVPKALIGSALALLALFQISGHVLQARKNRYATDYAPTIAFLRSHAMHGELIMGGSELYYGLGEGYRFVDDPRLGKVTGERPDLIVEDTIHPGPENFDEREPDTAQYMRNLLTGNYRLAATFGDYRILVKTGAIAHEMVRTKP
jgi:4-amino-4-deoxy-L-arabinose transferase-like glycosyltransferase